MSQKFKHVVEYILKWEADYSNDPKDPGGETNFGISKRAYPDVDIKNLTREGAIEIYRSDYWDACRCEDLPAEVATMVFDMAVNQGVPYAKTTLQTVLGVKVDGNIGPLTMSVAKASPGIKTMHEIADLRAVRYLSMNNATEERYEKGWIKRLIETVIVSMGG